MAKSGRLELGDSFHTKKLCSRLSSSEVQTPVLRFWTLIWGLEAMYVINLGSLESA